jgi:hypothetical protein
MSYQHEEIERLQRENKALIGNLAEVTIRIDELHSLILESKSYPALGVRGCIKYLVSETPRRMLAYIGHFFK